MPAPGLLSGFALLDGQAGSSFRPAELRPNAIYPRVRNPAGRVRREGLATSLPPLQDSIGQRRGDPSPGGLTGPLPSLRPRHRVLVARIPSCPSTCCRRRWLYECRWQTCHIWETKHPTWPSLLSIRSRGPCPIGRPAATASRKGSADAYDCLRNTPFHGRRQRSTSGPLGRAWQSNARQQNYGLRLRALKAPARQEREQQHPDGKQQVDWSGECSGRSDLLRDGSSQPTGATNRRMTRRLPPAGCRVMPSLFIGRLLPTALLCGCIAAGNHGEAAQSHAKSPCVCHG